MKLIECLKNGKTSFHNEIIKLIFSKFVIYLTFLFNQLQNCSIEFKSGEYGGKYTRFH